LRYNCGGRRVAIHDIKMDRWSIGMRTVLLRIQPKGKYNSIIYGFSMCLVPKRKKAARLPELPC
jgi:hypothetical protein